MTITETSRSEFITLRGLRTHVRQWGEPGAPKLFMLHGWMDVAASFQFLGGFKSKCNKNSMH